MQHQHPTMPVGLPDDNQAWPQCLRCTDAVFSVAMFSLAILLAYSSFQGAERGDATYFVGFAGGTALAISLFVIGIRDAGIRYLGLSRSITVHEDPVRGLGLAIPVRKSNTRILSGILFGTAAYGASASLGWFLGFGESLMPSGRDTLPGAVLLLAGAIVMTALALFVFAFRATTELRIFPSGVERIRRRRSFLSVRDDSTFLPWDDIGRIEPRELPPRTGSAGRPIIHLYSATGADTSSTRHDSTHPVSITAHQLVAEPNTLFALLEHLRTNPDQRSYVRQRGAVELLRPPPLRKRLREARIAHTTR